MSKITPAVVVAALVAWDAEGQPDGGLASILGAAHRSLAKPPAKSRASSHEAIFDAFGAARAAAQAALGESWAFQPGASVLIRLPFTSFSCIANGRPAKIKCRQDNRAPAARYWPGGVIPEGVEVYPDYARETAPLPNGGKGFGLDGVAYGQWISAWASRNNLVLRAGRWVPADEAIEEAA